MTWGEIAGLIVVGAVALGIFFAVECRHARLLQQRDDVLNRLLRRQRRLARRLRR